jgi:hypothetical protein
MTPDIHDGHNRTVEHMHAKTGRGETDVAAAYLSIYSITLQQILTYTYTAEA